jgi:hypothetical protein
MSTAAAMPPQAEIIERLPFEKYVQIEGVHATSLKDMLVSPLLYNWRRTHKRSDTDSLRVGRAGHTAILEPDRFPLEYTVWRAKMGRRFGKKWDEFKQLAASQGQTILTEAQYDTALAMRDAARAHPRVKELLDERGKAELTIRWQHPRTGLPCVSRIDYLCSAIVDVKTTKNPHPAKFASDAARYGYLMQAGFYGDACASAGLGALPFKIMSVQNVPPYDVVVFNIPEALLAHGVREYEKALSALIACREARYWPGVVPQGEVDLMLPAWAAVEDEAPDESQPISEDVEF